MTYTSKSAVGEPCRVAWRTVGSIIIRVVDDARAAHALSTTSVASALTRSAIARATKT